MIQLPNTMVEEIPSSTLIPLNMEKEALLPLRQMAYRLFASLFLYPDRERMENLQFTADALLASRFWQGYPYSAALESLLNQLIEIDLENERPIINEYNRLFLIRPKAPPHETIYTDAEGQMRGMLTARLEEKYLEAGLAISPDLNELPDHISVELEFMAYLCMKEAEARQANDEDEAIRLRALQRSFVGQHLARWFPNFAQRIEESEPRSIYQFSLPAVYSFLWHELSVLGLGD
jgi:TorA maturation chaperone TorD